jgi:two-component system, LytTR family, sensor kinase
MRRAAGFARQTEAAQRRTWTRILFMAPDDFLRFGSFWQLQMMGWSCFYVWGLLGSIPDLLSRPGAIRENTVSVAIMFLASCALHPVCRRTLRRLPSWLAFELRAAAWSVIAANVSAFATGLTLNGFHKMDWSGVAPIAMESTFVLFMWCSLYFSIKQWRESARERERLLRAETEARKARLRALRYQLNPHFLFNSLNAVSTLILEGNASAATRMLAQIGDLLRTSLESEVITEIALSQEMAFTEQYLAIEQTRLGERLQFEMLIPSETLDALVPSLLLQPLVENAVRYGVAPLVQGGKIAIESALHDDRLRIVIGNSGRRDAEKQKENGNGIGLSNTAERLKTLYGTNHTFSLRWPEEGGCEVTVELPFRRIAHLQEVLSCAP